MALVSLRNFTLPFANKVHLFTILLTGVVFAAFRLSTGAIEVRNLPQYDPKNRELMENLKEKNIEASAKKSLATEAENGSAHRAENDFLGQILGPSKTQEKKAAPVKDEGDALGEIEKSLGLR